MFNIELIPDSAYHDAIRNAFGSQQLVRRQEGYNFRCPICKDTSDNPNDRNAWVLISNGMYWYHCFKGRCRTSQSLISYLKEREYPLYQNLLFNCISDDKRNSERISKKNKPAPKTEVDGGEYFFDTGELQSINSGHPACIEVLKQVKDRKIPKKFYDKWFVAIKDHRYRKEYGGKGNVFANRIIIPYYRLGGTWKYFQGRSIAKKASLRYLSAPSIIEKEFYRIDWLDYRRPFFLMEGALDSTFVKNAVAFSGVGGLKRLLREYPDISKYRENAIFIWDNTSTDEFGNEIDEAGRDMLLHTSKLGFKYFDWESITSSDGIKIKDINDLVLHGDNVPLDKDGMIETSYLLERTKTPMIHTDVELEFQKISKSLGINL